MDEKIGTALQARLQSAQDHDALDVNIFLKAEPAHEVLAELALDADVIDDPDTRVGRIQEGAARSQEGLLSYLQGFEGESHLMMDDVFVPKAVVKQSFWINNSVAAEVSLQTLQEILERPDVLHIELSRHVDFNELLDDWSAPFESSLGVLDAITEPTWSVKRINAHRLWDKNLTGEGVTVAIVDSGVNYEHPDLMTHMWDGGDEFPKHGFDFMNNDQDPMDDNAVYKGHGTACAGIVAGDGTSGSTTGVAPKATIMALKAGNTERTMWDALEFAIKHKAQVISMSMSWKFPSHPDYPGWRRTCEAILVAGILHANSIGNQGNQLGVYPIPFNIAAPGNCPPPRLHPLQPIQGTLSSPISCGATDDTDTLADYSGRGPAAWEVGPYTDYPHFVGGAQKGLIKPDVCAPGPGTTSCNWEYPNQPGATPYRTFGGTSAATPHVGGCLALLAQACKVSGKPIVPARVQEALENSAVRVNGQTQNKENHFGAGRVDVLKAYQYGQSQGWW